LCDTLGFFGRGEGGTSKLPFTSLKCRENRGFYEKNGRRLANETSQKCSHSLTVHVNSIFIHCIDDVITNVHRLAIYTTCGGYGELLMRLQGSSRETITGGRNINMYADMNPNQSHIPMYI